MKKIKFNRKLLFKSLLFQVLVCILLVIFFYKNFTKDNIASAIFISGLLFVCIGLFRLTRALQFYDLPIYGVKKLIRTFTHKNTNDVRSQSYTEYLENNKYTASYVEIIVSGIFFIAISIVIMYLV